MIKDSYPLMNIQEILHSLQGATVFSSPDACGVYHAVRIQPASRACAEFISPFGTFQYIHMLFGLAKAGRVYSRMLDVAMKEVEREFWTSYLDDILTYSREPWDHFGHLTQVNLAHAAAGIKIQPCKTKLLQSEVEYLGHKISKGAVSMIQEYICTEDQRLASPEDWERSSYVPGFHRVLQNLHNSILSINKLVEWD